MEAQQIIDSIFLNTINVIAFYVILVLTILAFIGTFTNLSNKVKYFSKQSPAILATVGIFFSFWGISIGLIGLDLTDIQNSIPNLLNGLKVKFIASLMGILASIIVRIAQSFSVQGENKEESDKEDQIIDLLVNINKTLKDSAKESPDEVLRELREVINILPEIMKNQTKTLESIKMSLAGEGDASVTTQLTKVRMDMKDTLREMDVSNARRGESLNNTIIDGFGGLTHQFENFAKLVAENNSKAFIEALEKAMRDFNNNITEQFGENFKHLNQAVVALVTWQDNYKNHVEALTQKFDIATKSVAEILNAFTAIQTKAESFSDVSNNLGDVLLKLDAQINDMNFHLKALSMVSDNAREAFPIIEDNLTKLTSGFKKSTEQSLFQINSAVETAGDYLQDTTLKLKDTSGKMRESMESQRNAVEETSQEFKAAVKDTLNSLEKETKLSIDNYKRSLQEAVAAQLDVILNNINKSNELLNYTVQNASNQFEKSIVDTGNVMRTATTDMTDNIVGATRFMENTITDQKNILATASNEFHKTIQDTANDFNLMAGKIAESVAFQEKTLKNIGINLDESVKRVLNELTEQSKASIRDYEKNLHEIVTSQFNIIRDSITNASREFNRLLAENTVKSTNVLDQQTQLLDQALQEELRKAIETMGKHLASLSNKFVQDYAPLTEKLRDVVRIAEDLKRGQ